jgi:hypothetical protein
MKENPTMPSAWSDNGSGESFVWDDYVMLFEVRPQAVMEVLGEIAGQKITSPIQYLYALCVFYRPDRGHRASSLPILTVSVEATFLPAMLGGNSVKFNADEVSPRDVFLCQLSSGGHANFGNYNGGLSDNARAKEVLLQTAARTLQLTGAPESLGAVRNASGLNTGETTLEQARNKRDHRGGIGGFFRSFFS